MKRCTHCGEFKSEDEFYSNLGTIDGKSSWCKDCHNELTTKYKKESERYKEWYREYQRQYAANKRKDDWKDRYYDEENEAARERISLMLKENGKKLVDFFEYANITKSYYYRNASKLEELVEKWVKQ